MQKLMNNAILVFLTILLICVGFVFLETSKLPKTTVVEAEEMATQATSSSTLLISGEEKAYRGSELEYTVSYEGLDFVFLEYTIDNPNYAEIIPINNQNDRIIVRVKETAVLYDVFTLTVTDVISSESATISIMVLPVYANEIGTISMYAGDKLVDYDTVLPEPGDHVTISIQDFVVDEVTYPISQNVTYKDFAIVLDSTAEAYAEIDDLNWSFTIKDEIDRGDANIVFTVVVIQPEAPEELIRLTKQITVAINVPVKSLEVSTTTTTISRGSIVNYTVKYNHNNVATQKGYTLSATNLDGSTPISSYYTINFGTNTYEGFQINIDSRANYGTGIKVKIKSISNPSISEEIQLEVGLLEEGYNIAYSKDYQGTTNSNNGIQLVEKNNVTQLRNGYKADFFLIGRTTGNQYTISELKAKGIDVIIDFDPSDYFNILDNTISLGANVTAYTGSSRTVFGYEIAIKDGTHDYDDIQKKVEVYRPLGTSSYGTFYLDGASDGYLKTSSSYSIVFSTNGNNFTAKSSDIAFVSSTSYCTITGTTFRIVYPEYIGNSLTITAQNTVLYNNQNIDSGWKPKITLYRRFVASVNQLQELSNASASQTYYLFNDISLSSSWEPIESFHGTLNLYGNTINITNKSISSSKNYGFIIENHGTIKNGTFIPQLVTVNSEPSSTLLGGVICAENFGTIENCIVQSYRGVSNHSFTSSTKNVDIYVCNHNVYFGGLVGRNSGIITNCKNYASIGAVSVNTGGVAGVSISGSIDGCQNYGAIYLEAKNSMVGMGVGGIIGLAAEGTNAVINCTNMGKIEFAINTSQYTVAPYIGQIAGRMCKTVSFSGCVCGGTVSIRSGVSLQTSYVNSGEIGMSFAGTTDSGDDSSCIAAGTLITLADGRQVPVETLTGNEMLLVWNLRTGSFDVAPILFIDHDAAAMYKIINLQFSDGTQVKVIYEHALWDFNLNKYVFLREDAAQYVGHWFNKQTTDANGNMIWTRVQLTNVTITEEHTTAWSPVTYGHLCIYVNGMLSMPGATEGLINIFEVDGDTMQIDQEQYLEDIATYGLFTYEEFAEIYPIPEAIFEAFGGEYLKVSLGKGLIDYETLGELIERYSEFFE